METCSLPTRPRVHGKIIKEVVRREGTLKRIHVNQPKIAGNHKHKRYEPVLTVKGSSYNLYGHEVLLMIGDVVVGRFAYREDDPLSCGARVWFETDLKVVVQEFENTYPEKLPALEIGDGQDTILP